MEPPLKHSCLCKNLLLSCWSLSIPEYRYQLPRYCHHQFPHKIRLFLSNNPSPAMFSIIYKLFRSNTSNSTPTGTKQLLLFPLRIVSVDVHAQKLTNWQPLDTHTISAAWQGQCRGRHLYTHAYVWNAVKPPRLQTCAALLRAAVIHQGKLLLSQQSVRHTYFLPWDALVIESCRDPKAVQHARLPTVINKKLMHQGLTALFLIEIYVLHW